MNCSICGNTMPDNAKFCAKCGTPVQDDPVAPVFETPVAPVFEAPVAPVFEEPTAAPAEETVIMPMGDPFVMPSEETVVTSPAPNKTPADPIMPTFDFGPMMDDPSASGAIIPPSTTEKVKKSKSGGGGSYGGGGGNGKKVVLIVAALILVLAILGALAIFVLGLDMGIDFGGDDDDDRKSSSKKDKDDDDDHKTPLLGGMAESKEDEEDNQEGHPTVEAVPESNLSSNNPYYTVYTAYTDYVLPQSNTDYVSPEALEALSYEELVIAQQEIYARHGQRTSDSLLQDYFDNRDWYTESNSPASLNDCEKVNLYLINYLICQHNGAPAPAADNPYLPYLFTHDGQILSNSSTQQQGAATLSGLTETELVLAQAEMQARKGYFPSDPQLFAYFSCNPNFSNNHAGSAFNEQVLSQLEQTNYTLIQLYLRKARGVTYTSTNPFRAVDNLYGAYVIPYSSTQKLVYADYSYMDLPTLCIARNEILARHGYTFTDSELLEYFLSQDWYEPNTIPGDTSTLGLSSVENGNVNSIKEYENIRKANGETY